MMISNQIEKKNNNKKVITQCSCYNSRQYGTTICSARRHVKQFNSQMNSYLYTPCMMISYGYGSTICHTAYMEQNLLLTHNKQ
jgi:hypothetical protein